MTVENIQEFINPTRIRITNGQILPMIAFFFLISMADVVTTAKFLSLGGTEGNKLLVYLLGLYGTQVLVPFKLAAIGFLSGVICILWRWKGVEPYRFFWILTSIILATVSIVLANIAYIFSLM